MTGSFVLHQITISIKRPVCMQVQGPAAQDNYVMDQHPHMPPAHDQYTDHGSQSSSQWQNQMTHASEAGRESIHSDAAYGASEADTALSDPHLRRLHRAATAWKAKKRQQIAD